MELNIPNRHPQQRHRTALQRFEIIASWAKKNITTEHEATKHQQEQHEEIEHVPHGHGQRSKDTCQAGSQIQVLEGANDKQDRVYCIKLLHSTVPLQK